MDTVKGMLRGKKLLYSVFEDGIMDNVAVSCDWRSGHINQVLVSKVKTYLFLLYRGLSTTVSFYRSLLTSAVL